MTENLTHILVFRTNINTTTDKLRIKEVIDTLPQVHDWSVDTDDVDRVLRIVSPAAKPAEIISLINRAGYQCGELE